MDPKGRFDGFVSLPAFSLVGLSLITPLLRPYAPADAATEKMLVGLLSHLGRSQILVYEVRAGFRRCTTLREKAGLRTVYTLRVHPELLRTLVRKNSFKLFQSHSS